MRYPLERTNIPEERCESPIPCKYKKVENSRFCGRHGANKELEKKAKATMYEFKLDRVRSRTNMLAVDPTRYSTGNELAILRLTLEDVINRIGDEGELFQSSDTIRNLIMSIEKVVQTCLEQDRKLKLLLTVQDVVQLIQLIMDDITEIVENEDTCERIAQRLSDRLTAEYGHQPSEIENGQQAFQLDQKL